jgi:hypothetical protein
MKFNPHACMTKMLGRRIRQLGGTRLKRNSRVLVSLNRELSDFSTGHRPESGMRNRTKLRIYERRWSGIRSLAAKSQDLRIPRGRILLPQSRRLCEIFDIHDFACCYVLSAQSECKQKWQSPVVYGYRIRSQRTRRLASDIHRQFTLPLCLTVKDTIESFTGDSRLRIIDNLDGWNHHLA